LKLTASSDGLPIVFQRHVLEFNVACDVFKLNGVRRFVHLNGRVQYLKHAIQRYSSSRDTGVQPHQILHRRKQTHVISHKRDERAYCHHVVDDQFTSVQKHKRCAECQHRTRQRTARKDTSCIESSASTEALVFLAKPSDFCVLGV
jgi:hypothetical protein